MGRSLLVGAVAAAVVTGSATGVLAAPASAPLAEVSISESLTPVLHGKATAAGSGSQSIRFSARTVGAASWDLLNGVSIAGTDAYKALPSGRLSIQQPFEYQIAHCDDTGCTDSAVQTGFVSSALGAGERPGATRQSFTIGDRIGAQVDVGTGNLLVTSTLFSLPRRSGASVDVGVAYNSATRRDAHFLNSVGGAGSGWRLSTARDVRLRSVPGQGVVFHGPNGLTGTFIPDGTGRYRAPDNLKMTLATVSGGGWTLYDHGSGDTHHFAGNGLLTKLTDRNGNATTFAYNIEGGLTSIRADQGTAEAATLSATLGGHTPRQIAELSQTAAGATRSVTFAYDPAINSLSSITDQEGRVTQFFYGGGGNLNRITAPGGAVTSFTYDDLGRVQTITQPTADPAVTAVTKLTYEAARTLLTDPNGNRTTYDLTADGWKLVSKATDAAGHVRSATYTPKQDVTTATNPAGTSAFGYDPAVNGGESLTSTTSATGAGSSFAYTNTAQATRYQPSSGTDAQGRASTYTYNGAGNRLSSADASSAQASVTYNGDGTVATATSPSGAITSYGYDTVGQLTSITPPAGSSLGHRSYTYDGHGRMATYTSGRGITETYRYDALDRVLEIDYSDTTPTVTYTYDSRGSIDTRTDASGLTDYGYDPLGRLTSRTHTTTPAGVSYSYDMAGNLATATNGAGTTSYRYDTRNLVTELTAPDGRRITFTHDGSGRRTDTVFHPTTGTSYDGYNTTGSFAAHTHTDYDAAGRITRVWTARAGNDADRVSDWSYSYASPGPDSCASAPAAGTDTALRWAQTDQRSGAVTTYCYDQANRLISATTPGGDAWAYTYDGNGNRTKTVKNGTVVQTLTVNSADQITSSGYAHDGSGNQTSGTGTGIGAATYNGAEQMVTRQPGTTVAAYTYAGTDQTELVTEQPTGGASLQTYGYGRTGATGLPLIESHASGTNLNHYLYDPQGTPLALLAYTGQTHYLALDGLGSPVAMVNQSGTHTAAYTYDPYGQVTATSPSGGGAHNTNIYRFAGGIRDNSSGLVHYGQRWYNPATGRFTQRDSLETLADPTRANRYEYAAGNPVNYVDPSGADWCGGAGIALGFIGLAATYAAPPVGIAIGLTGIATGVYGEAYNCGGETWDTTYQIEEPQIDRYGCYINNSNGSYVC